MKGGHALGRTWIRLSVRYRAARRRRRHGPRRTWFVATRRAAPSPTSARCGGSGDRAFLAEGSGATRVTAFDAMPATEEFERRRAERGSRVRFVRGDLHDPATPGAVGVHDVVWCSGLLYHTPHPLLALERLSAMTAELLVVGTKTIPEVPGIPQAAVFYPGLPASRRHVYSLMWGRGGVDVDFDPEPIRSYANWWWGLTPSALRAMLELRFEVVETLEVAPGTTTDDLFVVARRRQSLDEERAAHERALAQIAEEAAAPP